MANLKITQDPEASTLTGTEIIPVVQDGANKRTTITDILTDMSVPTINLTTNIISVGGTDLAPTRFVADWPALQAIPKIAENNNLIVLVTGLPKHRNIFAYTHSTTSWSVINTKASVPARSIMWLGDAYQAHIHGSSGTHPLADPRKPYYTTNITWVNLSGYIRGVKSAVTGTGTLTFIKANKTLQWTAAGDTIGPPVDTTTGGWFRLESGTSGKELYVCVKAINEPATDATDNVAMSGTPTIPHQISNYLGAFNAKYGNPFGENQYFYQMNGLDVGQAIGAVAQWEGIDTDLTVIDICTGSSRSSLANCDATLTTLLQVIKKRQDIGSRVLVFNGRHYNAMSDDSAKFSTYFTRKLNVLSDSYDFEVLDINRYVADPSGTISNPVQVRFFNSSDLQYHSVVGSLLIVKKILYPALSKYLPTRIASETDLVPYSVTETFGNLLTNGRLTGIAGVKTDGSSGRLTGDVPTSFTATLSTTGGHTMTAVCVSPDSGAPIARGDDIPGNIFRVTLGNVAVNGETFTFTQTSSISASNYAAGDILQFSGDISISAEGTGGIQLITCYLSAVGVACQAFATSIANNTPATLNGETERFTFNTQPVTIPTGTTTLNFIFTISMLTGGTAVISISPNLVIKKVIY